MVPAPAIKGKAIGTIEAVDGLSSLYNRMPKIISKARKNNTKEPATATKVNTTATANELINGTQPTSMKKWIFIGVGGLVVLTALYLIFRNKSSN